MSEEEKGMDEKQMLEMARLQQGANLSDYLRSIARGQQNVYGAPPGMQQDPRLADYALGAVEPMRRRLPITLIISVVIALGGCVIEMFYGNVQAAAWAFVSAGFAAALTVVYHNR